MPNILLDTSVLPRQGKLQNVVMSAVLRIAKQLSIHVCLPEIVVEESVNARQEAAEAAADRLGDAINQASKIFDLDPIYIPNPVEVAQLWREELAANFTILGVDPVDAKEALFREAQRIPPARGGRGARDSAIWLTARGHQQGNTETMFFVSANIEDFADRKTQDLHPSLQAEIDEGYGPIEFFRSLDALLDRMATRAETTVSTLMIEAMAPDLLSGLLAAGSLVDFASAEELANADLQVETVKVVRSYSVEGVILAHCDVTGFLNIDAEPDSGSALPADRFSVRLRCWLEVDEATSSPHTLEVFEVIDTKLAVSE